jgi:hypothetical protein
MTTNHLARVPPRNSDPQPRPTRSSAPLRRSKSPTDGPKAPHPPPTASTRPPPSPASSQPRQRQTSAGPLRVACTSRMKRACSGSRGGFLGAVRDVGGRRGRGCGRLRCLGVWGESGEVTCAYVYGHLSGFDVLGAGGMGAYRTLWVIWCE